MTNVMPHKRKTPTPCYLLKGVSEAWEAWEIPLFIHPCYLLQRRGRVGGAGGGGWGQGPAEKGGSEGAEYQVMLEFHRPYAWF